MYKILASILSNILIKFGQYLFSKIIDYFDQKELKKRKETRDTLAEKIKGAKTNEERKKYLEDLDRLESN